MAATPVSREVRTADGVLLHLARVPATGPRRGTVLCLHAMMADGRYFGAGRAGSFAATLAAAGLDVVVADFRGHGRSTPPVAGVPGARAGRGDWSFDDLVELDLPAMIAGSGAPPDELTIVGHSLGGLVAAAALGTGRIPPPRALVLAASTVWMHGPAGPPHRRALMATYRGVTALCGRAPIRALRVGTADESASYVAQLTGWARSGRWTSLRGVDYLASLMSIEVPTHAIAGAGDWMCRPADATAIAGHIPGCGAVEVIGRATGAPLDADHFGLITRPELTALRARIGALAAAPRGPR